MAEYFFEHDKKILQSLIGTRQIAERAYFRRSGKLCNVMMCIYDDATNKKKIEIGKIC